MSSDTKQIGPNTLDLRGLMCPEPVLKTKKMLDQNPQEPLEVLVDSQVNVMNLTRLANSLGLQLQSEEEQDGYKVTIKKNEEAGSQISPHTHDSSRKVVPESRQSNSEKSSSSSVVFIAKDTFGEGDRDFSVNLLNVFLQTIMQAGHRPQAILLANSGVRLMDPDSSVRKVLDEFHDSGSQVLACGLCVEYYGLKEKIKPEQITNMYAICEYLFSADKLITP